MHYKITTSLGTFKSINLQILEVAMDRKQLVLVTMAFQGSIKRTQNIKVQGDIAK